MEIATLLITYFERSMIYSNPPIVSVSSPATKLVPIPLQNDSPAMTDSLLALYLTSREMAVMTVSV